MLKLETCTVKQYKNDEIGIYSSDGVLILVISEVSDPSITNLFLSPKANAAIQKIDVSPHHATHELLSVN